jgi:hypothetical protein
MISIKDIIIFKISIFTIVYISILIIISPIIDNFFSSLKEDLDKKENKLQILGEIMIQLVFVSVIWYYLHNFLKKNIERILNIEIKTATENTISFISSIALIGLQKNLLDKLEYITDVHPSNEISFLNR